MTQLEKTMASLMAVFDRYASAEGNTCTLTKAEAKTLLEKELPGLIKTTKNQEGVDRLLKDLDVNGDAEIDFSEFVTLVAALTCVCHDRHVKK